MSLPPGHSAPTGSWTWQGKPSIAAGTTDWPTSSVETAEPHDAIVRSGGRELDMKKIMNIGVGLGLLALLAGCGGGTTINVARPMPQRPTVAVVQYAVDAFNPMRHTVRMPPPAVRQSVASQEPMLEQALNGSGLFGGVTPAAGFASNDAYIGLGEQCRPTLCPGTMVRFARGAELEVPPNVVQALAAGAGTDTVLFVYGAYWLRAGMRKHAVYRGNYALYGADGNLIVHVRAAGEADAGVFPGGMRAVQAWQNAAQGSFAELVLALQAM